MWLEQQSFNSTSFLVSQYSSKSLIYHPMFFLRALYLDSRACAASFPRIYALASSPAFQRSSTPRSFRPSTLPHYSIPSSHLPPFHIEQLSDSLVFPSPTKSAPKLLFSGSILTNPSGTTGTDTKAAQHFLVSFGTSSSHRQLMAAAQAADTRGPKIADTVAE